MRIPAVLLLGAHLIGLGFSVAPPPAPPEHAVQHQHQVQVQLSLLQLINPVKTRTDDDYAKLLEADLYLALCTAHFQHLKVRCRLQMERNSLKATVSTTVLANGVVSLSALVEFGFSDCKKALSLPARLSHAIAMGHLKKVLAQSKITTTKIVTQSASVQGRFCKEPALTNCTVGHYGKHVKAGCTLCPAGYAQADHGSVDCVACAIGKYTPHSGSARCNECKPIIKAGSTVDLTATTVVSVDGTRCDTTSSCAKGSYAVYDFDSTRSICLHCPSGYTAPHAGATACTACLPGAYQPKAAAVMCYHCSKGSYSQRGWARCNHCTPGMYQPLSAQHKCLSCNPNNDKHHKHTRRGYVAKAQLRMSSSDRTYCVLKALCPKGKYIPDLSSPAMRVASLVALREKNGTIASVLSTSCVDCPRGYYQQGLGEKKCSACHGGRYGTVQGATTMAAACRVCPTKYFAMNMAQVSAEY
jgi:hypothetical protein